jgi:hypothetical protein
MKHDRPRWRFRLSTLMLLVVIAAFTTYIVVDRWQRVHLAAVRRRATDESARAALLKADEAEAQRAQTQARRASSPAQAGTSPTADK